VYPETAAQLGDAFMALAYDHDDPPVERYSDRVAGLVRDHIPVRDTSKLLAKNKQKSQVVTAADVAKEIMKAQQNDEGACNITFLGRPALGAQQPSRASLSDADSQASSPEPTGSNALMFKPKLRISKPTPLAIVDTTNKPEAPDEQPKESIPPALESAEDFESAAFEALTKASGAAKLNKKRPAAASEPKKKPEAKAASKHVGKTGPKPKAKSGALKLGCKSCRGCSGGCKTCRNPNFGGWRGNAKEYYGQGGKRRW
jgi:hypothetical protein